MLDDLTERKTVRTHFCRLSYHPSPFSFDDNSFDRCELLDPETFSLLNNRDEEDVGFWSGFRSGFRFVSLQK